MADAPQRQSADEPNTVTVLTDPCHRLFNFDRVLEHRLLNAYPDPAA